MKKNRVVVLWAALLLLQGILAGCVSSAASSDEMEITMEAVQYEAEPEYAVEEIYRQMPDVQIEPLDLAQFYERFPDLEGTAEQVIGYVSDAREGLADVIIVKPLSGRSKEQSVEMIQDALRQYQDQRIREFENFDILDASQIAGDAVVFAQGEYVVLLMLPDNEAGRRIIDLYIPL